MYQRFWTDTKELPPALIQLKKELSLILINIMDHVFDDLEELEEDVIGDGLRRSLLWLFEQKLKLSSFDSALPLRPVSDETNLLLWLDLNRLSEKKKSKNTKKNSQETIEQFKKELSELLIDEMNQWSRRWQKKRGDPLFLYESGYWADSEEFLNESIIDDLMRYLLLLFEQKLKLVSNETEKKKSKNTKKKSQEAKKRTTSLLEFKKEKLEEDDALTSAQLNAMWKAVDASEKKQYAERAKEINTENGF